MNILNDDVISNTILINHLNQSLKNQNLSTCKSVIKNNKKCRWNKK